MQALWDLFSLLLDGWFGRKLTPAVAGGTVGTTPVAPERIPSPVPPMAEASDPEEPAPVPVLAEEEKFGPATQIAKAMLRKGYEVFTDNSQDYNLNLVGIRTKDPILDEYRCRIVAFWKQPDGQWKQLSWEATTLPGSRYMLEVFLNPKGCAILQEGQWRSVYALDIHNGKYKALCQRNGAVTVYRDGNRDRKFDLEPTTRITGYFGINIHAPVTPSSGMLTYIAQRVYASSAGCQVFRRVEDFLEFRALCEKAAAIWGNSFTYTLINERDLDPADRPSVKEQVSTIPDSYDDAETWDPRLITHSVGIRNKNLLNVKKLENGDVWRFVIGYDDKKHAIFPTYAKGLRAGLRVLRTYWLTHKLRTIYDIVYRWAPPTDTIGSRPGATPNNPNYYASFVSERMGIGSWVTLSTFDADGDVKNADQLYALVSAMVDLENGGKLELPREVFDEAVRLM